MFYGWFLAGFMWLMLIAALGGSVFAWGFYAKEIMAELGLTAADIGAISGLTVVFYAVGSPIVGMLIARFGCRKVMPFGALSGALGCVVVANSQAAWHLYFGYGFLMNGVGLMYSTLPAQTLITSWFNKYRARVLALFSTGISIGGFLWLQIHNSILEAYGWRAGWWIAASVSLTLAFILPFVIRNQPEDVDQLPDGETAKDKGPEIEASVPPAPKPRQTLTLAGIWSHVSSSQFIILVLVGVVLVSPNSLVLVHGRLHLESLGLSQGDAVAVLSISALVGLSGRLMSGLGDIIHPKLLLLGAVTSQAIGTFGLIFASDLTIAYISVGAIGIGIGAGMQTITVLVGRYFGREAFSTTQGLRACAAGGFNAIIPWAVGLSADVSGSYTIALAAEGTALIIIGVMAALFLREREQR